MALPEDFGQAVAGVLRQNPWQQSFEVSLAGMTTAEVAQVVDAVATGCAAAGVALKGIAVDAGLLPRPSDAPFDNAWYRHGQLIIADIALNDAMVVRRS